MQNYYNTNASDIPATLRCNCCVAVRCVTMHAIISSSSKSLWSAWSILYLTPTEACNHHHLNHRISECPGVVLHWTFQSIPNRFHRIRAVDAWPFLVASPAIVNKLIKLIYTFTHPSHCAYPGCAMSTCHCSGPAPCLWMRLNISILMNNFGNVIVIQQRRALLLYTLHRQEKTSGKQ